MCTSCSIKVLNDNCCSTAFIMQVVTMCLNGNKCVKNQQSNNSMSDHRVLLTPPTRPCKNQTPLPSPDPQIHTDLWDCPRGPELIIHSMCTGMIYGAGMAYVSVKYCVVNVVPIYVCETGPISLAFLKAANL